MEPLSEQGVIDATRELLLSYERLDGSWRHSLGITADEKLLVAFLAGRGVARRDQLGEWTGMTEAEVSSAADSLVPQGLLHNSSVSEDGHVLQLAKRGAVARLRFEAVFDDLAAAALRPGGEQSAAIVTFLHDAMGIFDAHAELPATD